MIVILCWPRRRKIWKITFIKIRTLMKWIFVHEGEGMLRTMLWELPFGLWRLPRDSAGNLFHQIEFADTHNRLLLWNRFSPIRFPKKHILSKTDNCLNIRLLPNGIYVRRKNLPAFDEKGDYLNQGEKERSVIWFCITVPILWHCRLGWLFVIHSRFPFTILNR